MEEGLRQKSKIDNMDYEDEFGDAFFQLIHLANQCGVDVDKCLERVFEKYSKYKKTKKIEDFLRKTRRTSKSSGKLSRSYFNLYYVIFL